MASRPARRVKVTVNCGTCNTELKVTETKCPECGTEIKQQRTDQSPRPQRRVDNY
jgi:predicted RNA-binding Zn-ribbon protein involved in translation (DUF1610 family)